MKRKPRKRLLSDHNTRRPGSVAASGAYMKKLTEEEVCAIIIHLGAVAYFCEMNTITVCIQKEE